MAYEEHTNIIHFGDWLSNNWHWVSGVAITLFIGVAWLGRQVLKTIHLPSHPTFAQLEEVEDGVLVKLHNSERSILLKLSDAERDASEIRNKAEERHDIREADAIRLMADYRKENMDAHSRLDGKIDKVLQTIISNMRGSDK